MDTKHWWESKINWVAVFGAVAPVLAIWHFAPDASFWTLLAAVAVSVQNLVIFVMRTWFTTKLVANSTT